MSKLISLREANQAFSRCIRDVEAGQDYVITRNGKPVARLAPIADGRVLSAEQEAARARTRERMKRGWPLAARPLDRGTLHER